MAVTSLFFIRHGETDFNKKGIIQGGGIDSDLNLTGQQQAQAFFDYYQHLEFDQLYCSTLKRTNQTLAPWLAQGYEVEAVAGIRELGWGVHEGKVPSEMDRAEFLEIRRRWSLGETHLRVPKGESPEEGWARAQSFVEEVHEKHRGKRILICSHGRQLRIMLSAMLQGDLSQMDKYEQPNTGLHLLEMKDPRKFRVHTLADVRHLIA